MTFQISIFVPIAAFVAIALFVVREFLDDHRKRQERGRKLKAAKLLLAFETERNFGAQRRLFNIVEDIRECVESDENFDFDAKHGFGRIVQYQRSSQGKSKTTHGRIILPFHTGEIERWLPIVAELDEALFVSVMKVYEDLFQLNHLHTSLMRYLLKEELGGHLFLEGFTKYALNHRQEMEQNFKDFYELCTGETTVPERIR